MQVAGDCKIGISETDHSRRHGSRTVKPSDFKGLGITPDVHAIHSKEQKHQCMDRRLISVAEEGER